MILYGLLWTLLWYLIIHSCILYYLTFLEGFLSNHMALEMSPLAPDLPCSIVRGPLGSQVDLNGFSMVVCASQRPVWATQGHSGAARLFLIWTCLYRNSFLFCKYLIPLKSHRNGCVSKFSEEKSSFEHCSSVPVIFNKYKRSILFRRPVSKF